MILRNLLLLTLSLSCSCLGYSQTIFRATPIDEEQNIRLDNLESKFASLEDSIKNLTALVETSAVLDKVEESLPEPKPKAKAKVASSCNCSEDCTCSCDGECSCSCSTKVVTQYVTAPVSYGSTGGSYAQQTSQPIYQAQTSYASSGGSVYASSSSGYYSSSSVSTSSPREYNLKQQIRAARPSGSTRAQYARVAPGSAKAHLQQHGYSSQELASLSTSEAVILHDLTHGGVISPNGSSNRYQIQTNNYNSCPNGNCGQRTGLFGFRRR